MSKGLNQCNFIGNLGKDPEVRHTASGAAAANFVVAVSDAWKDKNTGEQKEHTEWVRCTAWGRLGEICGEYLRKGSKVFVSGQMKTRKWQDESGQDRYSTEIVVREMMMLDQKQQGQQAPQQSAPTDDFSDSIPF